VISPPLYINKQSLGQANFKLSDYSHLIAGEFNYLTFSFTTSTAYTLTKFTLEFPYQEYENTMWTDTTLGYWEDGDSIPCSFWGTATENSEFVCMME